MKKVCEIFLALAVVWSFAASAADTGQVREFYACNFQDGKGIDDLMAIRDVIAEQIEKADNADLSNQVSLLWTPVKTNGQLDFLWFDMHENLNAMGRAASAFESSGGAAAVDALAAETVQCAAGIVTHEAIYQGDEPVGGPGPVLVESYRCELHPGKTVADAREAVDYWRGVIDDLDGYDSFAAYMQTPVVSQSSADLYYFVVHADIAEYAARTSTYRTSKGGMEADSRFNAVHRCESGLWNGEVVVGSFD